MTIERDIPNPDIKLRVAASLRQKLNRALELSGRTLNGEIVARLEESFKLEGESPNLSDRLAYLEKTVGDLSLGEHDVATNIVALNAQVIELQEAIHELKSKR